MKYHKLKLYLTSELLKENVLPAIDLSIETWLREFDTALT